MRPGNPVRTSTVTTPAVAPDLRRPLVTDALPMRIDPVACRCYRGHFVDLAGYGVRDLCWDGDDLLVLAGPTMSLDAPPQIFRWIDAAADVGKGSDAPEAFRWRPSDDPSLPGRLASCEGLYPGGWKPGEPGTDHAESLASLDDSSTQLLIAYDTPGKGRLKNKVELAVDVVSWKK